MTAEGGAEHARVDAEGNLVSAGERLRLLNERAGGAIGKRLVVPQLATLARLTHSLGVPISRSVIAADGDHDVELWVQTRPVKGMVEMALAGWKERPSRPSWLVMQPATDEVDPVAEAWEWRVDASLCVTAVAFHPSDVTQIRTADLAGRSLTHLVRLIDDDEGEMPILAGIAGRAAFQGQRAVRRDRADVEFVLSGQPITDEHGAFAGFTGQAEVASFSPPDEDTETFGANFSEHLERAMREPLDRIVARAETISAQVDGPLRRDYADYAGDIASAGRHLLSLVEDLSDLQDVERPGFAIKGEPIDLADLARRAGGLLGVRAADRDVRIDRPNSGEPLMAAGDFRRALQILVNLVGNAVRYSPQGGMVWLRGERDGESVVIVVADQGKGIAPGDQDRIFEKFERLDPLEREGSGLGLYISRRLARAMGGDVTVESAPGQGARFMLTLPAA